MTMSAPVPPHGGSLSGSGPGLLDAAWWSDHLTRLTRAHGVPGAALAVARTTAGGGRDLLVATSGVTNVVTGTRVLPDTLFQIGSHTKMWTTTLLMQLVDEGLLDLDRPVGELLPALTGPVWRTPTPITTRHLLTHQAGIDGESVSNWELDDGALEHFVAQLADARRLTAVGELWSYSNNAFDVAGRVVEVLRGTTWEQALRTHLAEPLGLRHVATSAEEAVLRSAAVGHLPDGEGRLQPTPRWGIPRKDNPAGGLATSVADLAEFMLVHLRAGVGTNGARVLSAASAQAMLVPQVVPTEDLPMGELAGQGIGWHLSDWGGTAMYGHDGGTFGQYAHVFALPAHQLVVALATAGGDVLPLFRAVDELVREALGVRHLGRPLPSGPPPPVDPDVLGSYEREALKCRVFLDDGGLRLGIAKRGPLHDVLELGSAEQVVELTVLSPRRFCYGDDGHRVAVEYLTTASGPYLWMDVAVPKVAGDGQPAGSA